MGLNGTGSTWSVDVRAADTGTDSNGDTTVSIASLLSFHRLLTQHEHKILVSHSGAAQDTNLLRCDNVAGRVVADISKDRDCQAVQEDSQAFRLGL